MKTSDLTFKVLAFSEIQNFDTDECIDWAIEMVFIGYDTPSLFILAGHNKPTNYFEIVDYLPTVFASLNLVQKFGDEAILSYCSYYIKKISTSDNIKENLTVIYKFCQNKNHNKLIYDFYLLYWAWNDFDYGNEYTHYWKNANRGNIEQIVVETAKNWITENVIY